MCDVLGALVYCLAVQISCVSMLYWCLLGCLRTRCLKVCLSLRSAYYCLCLGSSIPASLLTAWHMLPLQGFMHLLIKYINRTDVLHTGSYGALHNVLHMWLSFCHILQLLYSEWEMEPILKSWKAMAYQISCRNLGQCLKTQVIQV